MDAFHPVVGQFVTFVVAFFVFFVAEALLDVFHGGMPLDLS